MLEAHIYVVHTASSVNDWLTLAESTFRAKRPRWAIDHTVLGMLCLGLYAQTPVVVYHNTTAHVRLESAVMAGELRRGGNDPALIALVSQADQRFEIIWEIGRDGDLVPETANLMLEAAEILAEVSGGIALRREHLIQFDGDAFAQLMN
jgi:hypothetical protein